MSTESKRKGRPGTGNERLMWALEPSAGRWLPFPVRWGADIRFEGKD